MEEGALREWRSHVQDLFEAAKLDNDLNAIAAVLARYPSHPDYLLTFAHLLEYSGGRCRDGTGVCLASIIWFVPPILESYFRSTMDRAGCLLIINSTMSFFKERARPNAF